MSNLGVIVPVKKWAVAVEDSTYGNPPRAIMIDDGAVEVMGEDDNSIVFPLTPGVWHPMMVKQIVADGTTATTVLVGW